MGLHVKANRNLVEARLNLRDPFDSLEVAVPNCKGMLNGKMARFHSLESSHLGTCSKHCKIGSSYHTLLK